VAITFHFDGQTKTVDGRAGESILRIGLDAGIPIESACGGNGFCTTCLCHITKGMDQLNVRTDREDNMGILDDPERLTCQAVYEGNSDVEVQVVSI
jgi:ferredoxin